MAASSSGVKGPEMLSRSDVGTIHRSDSCLLTSLVESHDPLSCVPCSSRVVKNGVAEGVSRPVSSGVGAGGALVTPKVLICRKPGQNPRKFAQRCFDTLKCN